MSCLVDTDETVSAFVSENDLSDIFIEATKLINKIFRTEYSVSVGSDGFKKCLLFTVQDTLEDLDTILEKQKSFKKNLKEIHKIKSNRVHIRINYN